MDGIQRSTEVPFKSGHIPLYPRQDFLGVPLDCLTLADTIEVAETAIRHGELLHHACLNVAKFVSMRSNRELDADLRASHLISVDGVGIFWAARLLGVPVPERVAGIDLFDALLGLCASKGYRPYFLGACADVLAAAIERLQRRHPTLVLAGSHDGYFRMAEEPDVVQAIRQSKADCLFIAMPTPRKEQFLRCHRDSLGVPFIMGVGGSLDVMAGKTRRAPRAVQAMGLEWVWRMMQEPQRLAPRYFKTNIIFAAIMTKAVFSLRARRRPSPTSPARTAELSARMKVQDLMTVTSR